jgi:hypothetical protein
MLVYQDLSLLYLNEFGLAKLSLIDFYQYKLEVYDEQKNA